MKKAFMTFSMVLLFVIISADCFSAPRPWYVRIKIGFLAKWSIVMAECDPGWGICLSLDEGSGQNFLGFESDNNNLILKVSKSTPEAKQLINGTLEVKEDSPVDPEIIKRMVNFSKAGKTLFISKGVYRVMEEGDSYLVNLHYYLQ